MRRLEYARTIRGNRAQARTATEAVMCLAQVARERQRLEQERRSLEARLHRIERRLKQIAGTETRLVPMIRAQQERAAPPERDTAPAAPVDRLAEITLHY